MADIAWYDFGGDGPDLLLAHATGFHAHVWLPVVERLRSQFRCVAFDERGHGDSASAGSFSWHDFADDLLGVVGAAGLERPFGVGHSCGGALLLLAEEAVAGTFRALYCFEPVTPAFDDPPSAPTRSPLADGARRRRELFQSREAAYQRFASKPPFSRFAPEALRAYVDHGFDDLGDGTVRLKCRGEDEARAYENSAGHRAYADAARVQCPVTLAYGSETDAMGAWVMEPLAARLPDARVEVLEGRTHFGPQEDPADLAARIVRAFTAAAA
ncbi:MAG TPA: alpha/beta hydrolase [Acidimicrobiales bacterium]|nr:alpha/beta hydrolase [Acidimicrobiales bacterium]